MNPLHALVVSMRPRQYIKNLLVFAAVIFARRFTDPVAVLQSLLAFAFFSMLSSAVYLINDVVDIEEDRRHPDKRNRPIAAGHLAPATALAAAVVLTAAGVAGSFEVNANLGAVACGYLGLQLLYQFFFKYRVILDVLAIAGGFVLRAVAGAEAISVVISPWLLLCTLLLALFLGLAKRRGEIVLLESGASNHRKTLEKYSLQVLDQMIAVVTASTLMSYCLYTISERTVKEVGGTQMMYTIPFVIYGIFRYLYLMHRHGEGGHPDRTLLSDKPLLLNVVLYALTAAVIIYLAPTGA
ncbi:MAG: decaprenyl-phosphate phosphoribosyltransferase [Armatimonadetes bacterium]|nr:decaprenyl-phosphate phosphoribosyltransferase [Armatimonadota bacterium]